MDKRILTNSFNDSLRHETANIIGEFAELGLDSIIDEGILNDIPFISTIISLYNVGTTIKDRHNIKKLAVFLKEINESVNSQENIDKYISKLNENAKFREKELEYLLILIDRYIMYEQSKKLAKLYFSYICNNITWETFLQYSVIIDRLIPGDFEVLYEGETDKIHYMPSSIDGEHPLSFMEQPDAYLRLIGLGLMKETKISYKLTDFGDGFLNILGRQQIKHGYIEV